MFQIIQFYCFNYDMLQFLFMHTLKNALGKTTENQQTSLSLTNPTKAYNKSKNISKWTLDPDEDEGCEEQLKTLPSKKIKQIEAKILSAYQKDSNLTEMGFFEIIEQIQALSDDLEELPLLNAIQSSAKILQQSADESLAAYINSFLEFLTRRIKKLKKKQKKIELQEYDKIIKNNFKKKSAQFIEESNLQEGDPNKIKQNNIMRNNTKTRYDSKSIEEGSSSKRNGSSSSTEGKLGKLISSGLLKQQKKQQQNEQAKDHQEQSVSFSAVVSQSMATRQRKPKQVKKDKKQKEVKQLPKQQAEGNDQAFIFYRPKAGKKS